MDKNFNKYFGLMALLFGGFLGIILVIVIIFYTLKFFSIAMFNIPGSANVLGVFIVAVPYLLFFASYYYLHTKIAAAKTALSRVLSRIIMVVGSLLCLVTMIIVLMIQLKVTSEWLADFNSYSQYALIAQVILLFTTAGIIATGDPKEKNWMEKGMENDTASGS